MFSRKNKGINVLITAGATREPIDVVRHISNMATGRLGIEIAKESYERGYGTTLLYGFGTVKVPEHIETIRFTTTQSLLENVLEKINEVDVYISSAAVSDYAPVGEDKKIDSGKDELIIKLKPTPNVLKEARAASKPGSIFVGFKLGYNLTEEKLIKQANESYGSIVDLIVANDLSKIDGNKHEAILLYKGEIMKRVYTKQEIAKTIFDSIESITK